MGRDQVDAVLLKVVIEPIAIIGSIADEMLGLGLQHVDVETELHERDLMMSGRVRTDREPQPVPIHNRENLHALPAFREVPLVPAALRGGKGRIDETLSFIDPAFIAQRVRQLGQDVPQHLALTPLLKSPMDGFVIRITLREQVPLGPGVQNSEHGFQDRSGRHRFAPWAGIRDVLFREVFPNPVPLIITQAQHVRTYRDLTSSRQLF